MDLNTVYMKNDIFEKNNSNEVIEYIRNNDLLFLDWQRYINNLLQLRGCSYEKFGKMTGFSKNTIKSWCINGVMPRNRALFIKLAFGLKMNVEETNELLLKYGKYSKLYPKDLHDAIIIYVINKRINDWDNPIYDYNSLSAWEEKFCEILKNHKTNEKYYYQPQTVGIFNDILKIKDDLEFEKYILTNADVFFSSYSALIYFIDDFIEIRISEKEILGNETEKYSWHRFIKEKQLDSSFEIMLSKLKHDGLLPRREQLIALGIHLNMVANDIDKMLELAHMKPLYAKDKAESLLLYLLRNAEKIDPDLQLNNAWKYVMTTSDRHLKAEYQKIIDTYYGIDSDEEWENCIEDLSMYLQSELENLNLDDFAADLLDF